jgi:hypothetical protein
MAKVKSIITEADIAFMKDVEVEFVSLVGHAANRQPFKIIKGEVKGDNAMPKTIYSVLVSKNITEEKLQEIVAEHNFSVDEKIEDSLEGFDVYNQIEDGEVDLETKKMSALADGVYAIVVDLKEESEKEGLEKEEMEYETLDKVADSLFAMMDIVLGTMRQPEAEGTSRKEMIMTAVNNFTTYVGAVLANTKAEEVLENLEIKSEIMKEFLPEEKEEEPLEIDPEEFEENIKEELISKFTEMIETVKAEFEGTKEALNTSLNEQFDLYQKKEDVEKELETVKAEIEAIKNTTKSRNSELDEDVKKKTKTEIKKKQSFVTFV